MDTELARTFLTVVAAGNFVSAAERLYVSQSTISTRIHALEDYLGCTLFVRNKAGAVLTVAGRQFSRHAALLVRTVEQARHDVGIPKGFAATLTVGGRIGLWDDFLLQWLPLMHASNPRVAIRAESGLEPEIMRGLIEGRIDIGVLYAPQSHPGLKVEKLFEERLVLVSTDANARPEPQAGYVYVNWSAEFDAQHTACFPEFGPSLSTNLGWLGLRHVLRNGGSGYFPARLTQPYIDNGALTIVAGAPDFLLPAYAVYPLEHDDIVFTAALDAMHVLAGSDPRKAALSAQRHAAGHL